MHTTFLATAKKCFSTLLFHIYEYRRINVKQTMRERGWGFGGAIVAFSEVYVQANLNPRNTLFMGYERTFCDDVWKIMGNMK